MFTGTQQLDWGALDMAWKEHTSAHFWTTEPMGSEFFATLDAMGLAYTPVWKTYSECRSVFIRTQGHQGIRIKRVPHDHQQLLAFCECAKKRGIKLDYFGESAGVLCHKFMQRLLVVPKTHAGLRYLHQAQGAPGQPVRRVWGPAQAIRGPPYMAARTL